MPGFSNRLEYMHNRCKKPWSWQSVLTCIVSRQQREVLGRGKNRKLLKKETKKAGGERVLGVLVPPRDQFHKLKRVLYPLLQAPRGTRDKGQRGRTKARGHREGP